MTSASGLLHVFPVQTNSSRKGSSSPSSVTAIVGLIRALVHHDGAGVFEGVPDPFRATRYHSLAAVSVPDGLMVTATTGLPETTSIASI